MRCIVLSHKTAFRYWGTPSASMPAPRLTRRQVDSVLSRATTLVSDIAALRKAHPTCGMDGPVDVLVADMNGHRTRPDCTFHLASRKLPPGSLVRCPSLDVAGTDGSMLQAYVASPELCALQMARFLKDLELLELCCEYCGAYALDEESPRGFTGRRPVMSPDSLKRFIAHARGMHGVGRLRMLAPYVVAGAASPMEARVAMLAVLPRSHGGFELPVPALNEAVGVDGAATAAHDVRTIVSGICWMQARLVLECSSDGFLGTAGVDGREERGRVHEMLGMRVVSLAQGQLDDFDALSSIFGDVEKSLGLRRSPVTPEQKAAQRYTHWSLLHGARASRR